MINGQPLLGSANHSSNPGMGQAGTADDALRGTALTLQTAVGFILTLITIRGVPALAEVWSWQWAFPVLALGPALGVVAMVLLKRSPMAVRLAGGRG